MNLFNFIANSCKCNEHDTSTTEMQTHRDVFNRLNTKLNLCICFYSPSEERRNLTQRTEKSIWLANITEQRNIAICTPRETKDNMQACAQIRRVYMRTITMYRNIYYIFWILKCRNWNIVYLTNEIANKSRVLKRNEDSVFVYMQWCTKATTFFEILVTLDESTRSDVIVRWHRSDLFSTHNNCGRRWWAHERARSMNEWKCNIAPYMMHTHIKLSSSERYLDVLCLCVRRLPEILQQSRIERHNTYAVP